MIPEAADHDNGAVHPFLRVVGYGLSILMAFYLWLLCSPYKLQYGASGIHYYNDDGIFFGAFLSIALLFMHGFRAFLMLVVYRKKPSILILAFILLYFLTTCYWVYHATSNSAMHES